MTARPLVRVMFKVLITKLLSLFSFREMMIRVNESQTGILPI